MEASRQVGRKGRTPEGTGWEGRHQGPSLEAHPGPEPNGTAHPAGRWWDAMVAGQGINVLYLY